MMDEIHNTPRNVPSKCPHSDGSQVPICWDCAEEGHVGKESGSIAPTSPTWIRMNRKLRNSLAKFDGNWRSTETIQAHQPKPVVEANSALLTRISQPGLEVISGPTIVARNERETVLQGVGMAPKSGGDVSDEKGVVDKSPNQRRICGIRRRVFIILLVVVFLVAIATVLGVVLGLRKERYVLYFLPY